ncbi:MAG: hypothetical protein PF569_08170 [Candidatus Woesearchaeota archaeon]|jgi:hypothetical protein|nr:hypothetical protein [Candidatus Woesearchaeota archaeon]
MKIELNGPLTNLEGKAMQDTSIAKLTANVIGSEKSELDTVKAYVLAQSLYNGKAIDVEKDTLEKIKNAIEKTETLVVFGKAQIIMKINEELKNYNEK